MTSQPPPGFEPLPSRSPFVNRAGDFYIRRDPDGCATVGTWIGHEQSNAEGFAHGGFLLAFVDYTLTIVTTCITVSVSADFLRPARVGDWLEARINIRKRAESLLFADAIVTCGDRDLMRVSGVFRPFSRNAHDGRVVP